MKQGGGKAKGSQFERDVCKALSLWVTGGLKKDCFWRSAMSGGRATVARAKGDLVRQAGDITAVGVEGHVLTDYWYIECKHYRDLNLTSFFLEARGALYGFWVHAANEALKYNRRPMLIAKENGRPTLLIVTRHTMVGWVRGEPQVTVRWSTLGPMCEVWLFSEVLAKQFMRPVLKADADSD